MYTQQSHTVTLKGLSKYKLLLMAWAALPVFFNHPSIWQVLRLSLLNLKTHNKKLGEKTHTLHKCWFHGHCRFIYIYYIYCNYMVCRKKNTSKGETCFMSFITFSLGDCNSIFHKTSSMVNVQYFTCILHMHNKNDPTHFKICCFLFLF